MPEGVATPVERIVVAVSFADDVRSLGPDLARAWSDSSSAKTTVGAAFAALEHNDKYASPFGLSGRSRWWSAKLRAYSDGNGRTCGPRSCVRGRIHRKHPTGPGALVATSSAVTDCSLADPPADRLQFSPALLPGGVYWLGLHAGDSERVARYAYDLKAGASAETTT